MLATPASALGCRGDPHHCRTLRATNYIARLTRRHRYRYPHWSSRGGDHGHAGRNSNSGENAALHPENPAGLGRCRPPSHPSPVASANSSCVALLRPGNQSESLPYRPPPTARRCRRTEVHPTDTRRWVDGQSPGSMRQFQTVKRIGGQFSTDLASAWPIGHQTRIEYSPCGDRW